MSTPDTVQSAMFEILKRIQSDVSDTKQRVERLEVLVKKQGRDSAAMLIMMRGTVGVYDERIKVIEDDVRLLMESD